VGDIAKNSEPVAVCPPRQAPEILGRYVQASYQSKAHSAKIYFAAMELRANPYKLIIVRNEL